MLKDKQITIQQFDPEIIKKGMVIEFTIDNQSTRARVNNVYDKSIEASDISGDRQRYFDTEDVIDMNIRLVKR